MAKVTKVPKQQTEPRRQRCTGCAKTKAIDKFGRTSKARGNKPMRRCKDCIRDEARARREAARTA